MSQLDMFRQALPVEPVSNVPDPADVRLRMRAKLRELGEAESMPWSSRDLALWRTLWPQMSRWLPDDERAEVIKAFNEQLARLNSN